MHKPLLTFLSLLLLVASCNSSNSGAINLERPRVLHEDSLALNRSNGTFTHLGKLFNGQSILLYSSGSVSRTIDYKNGKKDGSLRMFYPNGKISYQAIYRNGKLDGPIESWWKNGNKRSESYYKEGKVHGIQKQWYSSGEIFKILRFNQGIEDGLQTAWRKNGKIYTNYEAKNGRIFGLKRATLCYTLEDEEIQFNN